MEEKSIEGMRSIYTAKDIERGVLIKIREKLIDAARQHRCRCKPYLHTEQYMNKTPFGIYAKMQMVAGTPFI